MEDERQKCALSEVLPWIICEVRNLRPPVLDVIIPASISSRSRPVSRRASVMAQKKTSAGAQLWSVPVIMRQSYFFPTVS